ncbi:MAG: hypothetical protein KJ737_17990 [Proteobacteria bacterium]|nr:hypothetical protein [Pseudomonadota bacterium]
MSIKQMGFSVILFVLKQLIPIAMVRDGAFKERIRNAPDFTAQIRLKNRSQGRYFTFKN